MDAETRRARPNSWEDRPWPIEVKRAAKALGIINMVQDHYKDDPKGADAIWEAAIYCFRPGSRVLLNPFAEHCREWPSNQTWRMVGELGKRFEVIKLGDE